MDTQNKMRALLNLASLGPWRFQLEHFDGYAYFEAECSCCNSKSRGATSVEQAFDLLAQACSCQQLTGTWQAIKLIKWLTRHDPKRAGHIADRKSSNAPPAQRRDQLDWPGAPPQPGGMYAEIIEERDFNRRWMRWERQSRTMDPDAHDAWGNALADEARKRASEKRLRARNFFAPG